MPLTVVLDRHYILLVSVFEYIIFLYNKTLVLDNFSFDFHVAVWLFGLMTIAVT